MNGGSEPWTIVLNLNSSQTEFKIDTGANVTVIPECVYNECGDGPISSPDRILCGPSKRSLQVLGKFQGTLRKGQLKTQEQIYVVRELWKALLGRPAIKSLGLLIRADEVLTSKAIVISKYPQFFKDLGCMKGAYHIDLKPETTHFALTVPRRVAIPLMEKVKTKLQ